MAIFSHSEFVPVFLVKIVGKNSEWPFLAILIYTSLFEKNCCKKFGMAILAVSNLYQSFREKLSEKNLEWPFLAILNLYKSFWEKLSETIQNGHFWPF